jgi:hypothetical protein
MTTSLRACSLFVKRAGAAAFATALVILSGCASINAPEREPTTLEQIVAMAKEGKDAASIIKVIRESRTTYDVMASQYAKLSRDGVPDEVIDFMQRGQLRMAERQGRRNAYDDLWLSGRFGWTYGGVWAPRAYFVYVNGRPHTRFW